MGLDNIPKPHPCEVRGTVIRNKEGKIDCQKIIDAGNCEFAKSGNPTGVLGTYCWFRGKALVRELKAIGYPDSSFLYNNLKPKELREKAEELEKFLEQFKQIHENNKKNVTGAGWNGKYTENDKILWQSYSSYEEIVDIIEKGIRWLRRLSELNCEVIPWF